MGETLHFLFLSEQSLQGMLNVDQAIPSFHFKTPHFFTLMSITFTLTRPSLTICPLLHIFDRFCGFLIQKGAN